MASAYLRKHATKPNLVRVEYRTGGRDTKAVPYTGYVDRKTGGEKLAELKAQFAEDKAAGKPLIGNAPLAEVMGRWVESRVSGGHAKRSWISRARKAVEKLAAARKWTSLSDITAQDLNAWIVERVGIRPGMTSEEEAAARMNAKGLTMPLKNVKALLCWARDVGDLRINAKALGVKVARGPRRKSWPLLTVEQVGGILAEALRVGGVSFATLLEHLCLYGCRPVDLCRLKAANWNSATREVTYRGTYAGDGTKNGEEITHLCHAAHAEKLNRLAHGRAPTDSLFVDAYGNPWKLDKCDGASSLCTWYQTHVGKVVVPSLPQLYHLKRFAITRLVIGAKGNRKLVMNITGHKDASMVDRYSMVNLQGQRELIAAVPMENASAESLATVEAEVVDSRPLATPDTVGAPIARHMGGKRAGSGFASLSPEKRREIAQRAYAKALASGKLHRFTSAEAKAAAKLGGFAVMDPRRRLVYQTIGQETARELGLSFNAGSGKAARQAQLDRELIVIEDA